MRKALFVRIAFFLLIPLVLIQCDNEEKKEPKNTDDDFNLFSVERDKEMGRKFSNQIESDTSDFDVLDSATNTEPYDFIYRVRDEILENATINYKNTFKWRVRIIQDTTLNAFCTPGGYIYFYTGLIKYLDNEADFAGVLGHEMAHAAERHSTEQLTKQYGQSILISIIFGSDPGKIVQVASGLATLKFSRGDEKEADDKGVEYLNPSEYDARGVAGFFEKLKKKGNAGATPQFLSTHPSPENRVDNIIKKWKELGSKEGKEFPNRYEQFKKTLPQ